MYVDIYNIYVNIHIYVHIHIYLYIYISIPMYMHLPSLTQFLVLLLVSPELVLLLNSYSLNSSKLSLNSQFLDRISFLNCSISLTIGSSRNLIVNKSLLTILNNYQNIFDFSVKYELIFVPL